jgi:signal transduction histidine kinase
LRSFLEDRRQREVMESDYSPPRQRGADDLPSQLEVLQGLCHAFGAAEDLSELTAMALQWVRAAVGPESSVRLSLQDRSGRLRTVAEEGTWSTNGRGRSTRRRLAFETKAPLLEREGGAVTAVLPLVSRGESVGVLEVVASREAVQERRGTLEAVASQIAAVARNLRHRELLEESLSSAAVVGDLVRAESLEEATRAAMDLSFRVLQAPVAAWVLDGKGSELRFLEARGATGRRREELEAALPTVRRWGTSEPRERARVTSRFAEVMGSPDVAVMDGGVAVLLGGGDPSEVGASLEAVGSLFREVVRRLSTLEQAERRNEQLDMGIAWTAHEVRGPLLAAKAAMEALLAGSNGELSDRHLLARSRDELAQLAGLVDAVLRWAVGAGPLHRKHVDLVRLIGGIAKTCSLDSETRRVVVSAPDELKVRLDAKQMRTAIANVVRNALSYSPPQSEVSVGVRTVDHHAIVTVKDRGPGIPPSERHSIFDPFVRGGAGPARTGKGLGLFIARRVVEAHGGTIWIDPVPTGGVFHIMLPLNGGSNGNAVDKGEDHASSHHR